MTTYQKRLLPSVLTVGIAWQDGRGWFVLVLQGSQFLASKVFVALTIMETQLVAAHARVWSSASEVVLA